MIKTYTDDGEPILDNIVKEYGYLLNTAKELYIDDNSLSIEMALAQCVDYISATTEYTENKSIDYGDITTVMLEYLKRLQ